MSKIRRYARGQNCTVRIPGYCNFNPETTILAHRNGYGVGGKNPDYQAALCCSSCHDVLDGRWLAPEFDLNELAVMFADGVWETQELLRKAGLIKITGETK